MNTSTKSVPAAKNLSEEPPRSPRVRVGGYAILGRTIDKCRAELNGTIGEYHYDCPLDKALFGFAGVTGAEFKEQVKGGASDDELARWVSEHGARRSPEEIGKWSEQAEQSSLGDDPEKREFFVEETRKLGLDPDHTSTFTWLEADDRASFGAK